MKAKHKRILGNILVWVFSISSWIYIFAAPLDLFMMSFIAIIIIMLITYTIYKLVTAEDDEDEIETDFWDHNL